MSNVTGSLWEEAIARHQPDWDTIWEHDPYVSGFPGAETVAEFHHRVAGAMHSLLRRTPVGRSWSSATGA